jgi:3'(2'), 5'-bisphosphate nucleotidase
VTASFISPIASGGKSLGRALNRPDLTFHHPILKDFALLSPNCPVLSQGSPKAPFDERKSWRHFWVVEPVGGTKKLLRPNGEFTVNIALMDSNVPIFGIVYASVIDKLYYDARSPGAHKVDRKITTQVKAAQAEKQLFER